MARESGYFLTAEECGEMQARIGIAMSYIRLDMEDCIRRGMDTTAGLLAADICGLARMQGVLRKAPVVWRVEVSHV